MRSSAIFDKIQSSLAESIDKMNRIIKEALSTSHEMANEITDNFLKTKGKQLRPILVMLAARMFGEITKEVLYAGASLEMLHNASLIHDDVVDQAPLRRGKKTVNDIWGNHIAVLIGDLFISKSLSLGLKSGKMSILQALSDLGTELSLGEMDELFNARRHSLDEKSYFLMIQRKTASLFMSCIRIGAEAVDAPEEKIKPLEEFGRLLGLAFQIRDDVFDYFPSKETGKPSGHDLLEGKVTLPLIHAIDTANENEAKYYREMLTADTELTPENISALQQFAISRGGVEYAFRVMENLREEACAILDEYPDSPYKEDLKEIFRYIIERNS